MKLINLRAEAIQLIRPKINFNNSLKIMMIVKIKFTASIITIDFCIQM